MFAKLGFEWGERRRIFLTSWRVIIRWSLETHSTSKIASEEDESHSRIKYLFFEKTDVSRQLHPTAIHLRLATSVWRERSLTMTALPLFANSGKRLLWLLENGLITQHWALRSLARVLHACISTIPKTRQKDFRNLKQFQNLVLNIWTALK